MARKLDPEIRENVDRAGEKEQEYSADADASNHGYDGNGTRPADTIKNASAAGLGAIGRNDENQTGHTSDHSADAGNVSPASGRDQAIHDKNY